MEHGLRAAVADSPANSMTHAVITRRQLSCRVAVAALLVAYALVLLHHTSFSAGGSDSSGYVNGARLLAEGRAREPIRGLARLGLSSDFAPVFTPLGYTAARQPGTMAPSYPPGLPLHMALAALLTGWSRGPFFVSPIAGLVCLVLLYALGRELDLPPPLALAGCALLAFNPTFVFQTLQPMSDVLATAWALAAVLAAYRARGGSVLWAAAAGAAFGVGVLVRPTNALVLLPLLVALPARAGSWLSFAAGGVPFPAFPFPYGAPSSPVGSRDRYRSPRGSARGRDRLRREESRSPILQVRADLSAGLRARTEARAGQRDRGLDADERRAALLHGCDLRDVELAPAR